MRLYRHVPAPVPCAPPATRPAGSEGRQNMTPLFVCHANASRSMLAAYLYQHLCAAPALSAGVYAGTPVRWRCLPTGASTRPDTGPRS